LQTDGTLIKSIAEAIEVLTNDRPTVLYKVGVKTIWTRSFIRWEEFNHSINLLFLERDRQ
jgi:hypothetical protein